MDRGQEPISGTPTPLPAPATRRLLGRIELPQVYPALMVVLICLGTGIRLRAYLFNRSLWLDEASLALNIVNRSISTLFLEPLGWGQAAPPGFLVAQKFAVQAFGSSEYALRLVPFLSGVLSLLLFAYLAKRWLSPTGALVAVGLFALSDSLIYYSTEAKQYSSDVTVALLLCCLTVYYESRPYSIFRLVLLGTGGAIAVFFSHSAVFVLPGLALYLTVPRLIHKDWGEMRRLCLVFLFWAASFATCYLIFLRNQAANPILLTYWSDSFWPVPPHSVWNLLWPVESFLRLFDDPASLRFPGLIALLCIVGGASILTKKREVLFILLLPILLALVASGLHRYPFRGRLMLFVVPAILWLVSEGAGALIDSVKDKRTVISLAVIGLLFFYPLLQASVYLVKPRTQEEIKPVMGYLRDHWQKEDRLYLYYQSLVPFQYYADRYGFSDSDYTIAAAYKLDWNQYEADLAKLRGRGRLWILVSHVTVRKGMDEEEFLLNYLDTIGTRLDAFKAPGASVYLYDLR